MAVSDALLPSFSTFASGPAGREKTLRQAGAPNNVSIVSPRAAGNARWVSVGVVGAGGALGSLRATERG